MVRTPWFDKSGRKKGSWTAEEDKKLIAYVTRYGCWNWRQLPRFAGLARCGKSCRLRWLNYLRPDVKRGDYSQEEEEVIVNLHQKLGSRWSAIAANLPGRTDNDIKNHWNSTLKKRFFFPTPKTLQQQQQDFQFVNNNTNQEEEDDDIWSESFLAELMQDNNNNNNNEYYCSVGYYGLESTLLLQPAVENSWIHQFVADDISHVPNHLFPHQFSQ